MVARNMFSSYAAAAIKGFNNSIPGIPVEGSCGNFGGCISSRGGTTLRGGDVEGKGGANGIKFSNLFKGVEKSGENGDLIALARESPYISDPESLFLFPLASFDAVDHERKEFFELVEM